MASRLAAHTATPAPERSLYGSSGSSLRLPAAAPLCARGLRACPLLSTTTELCSWPRSSNSSSSSSSRRGRLLAAVHTQPMQAATRALPHGGEAVVGQVRLPAFMRAQAHTHAWRNMSHDNPCWPARRPGSLPRPPSMPPGVLHVQQLCARGGAAQPRRTGGCAGAAAAAAAAAAPAVQHAFAPAQVGAGCAGGRLCARGRCGLGAGQGPGAHVQRSCCVGWRCCGTGCG